MLKPIVILMIFVTIIRVKGFGNKGQESSCPDDVEKCEPYFTGTMPDEMNLSQNEVLLFLCLVSGNPAPDFTWAKDGVDLRIPFASWTIKNLQLKDEGNYTCEACNKYGCVSHSFQLHVKSIELKLKKGLKNDTVVIGKDHSFECFHNQPEDRVSVDWFPHTANKIIPDGVLTDDIINKKSQKTNLETYDIFNVTMEDEGWYACRVHNGINSVYSYAYLTIAPKNYDCE